MIRLTQGKVTRVSQEDFVFLEQWGWYAHRSGGHFYAARNSRVDESEHKIVMLHRIIAARMGLDLTHMIDHIDGDGLNNIRSNLRAATNAQNLHNTGKHKTNTSGFKGACGHKASSKWQAKICCDGVHHHLGLFDTKEDAAKAYRKAAKRLHKEFAHA